MPARDALAMFVGLAAGLHVACAGRAAQPPVARPLVQDRAPADGPAADLPATAASLFTTAVRPILSRRCGECHDPGGRMHARLPFDDPGVVREHRESILRRLKDPDERGVVEGWLTSSTRRSTG